MKAISLLGSTGSIGQSTLDVVRFHSDSFKIVALAAGSNELALEQQIKEFQPELVVIYDDKKARQLRQKFPKIEVLSGMKGLIAVASFAEADVVVSAISGAVGLEPTVAAINAKKTIALANKEVLVCGGEWIMNLAKRHHVTIIPVDSEHSALFQCLNGENTRHLRRIILTASGGPFRSYSYERLKKVQVEDALRHPVWNMGAKITIDSSTLMNKGLEVIEARWLFDVPPEKIEVVVHPQHAIHSLVEFCDSSILAQMSRPHMTLPIQYALTYPDRMPGLLSPFDFSKMQRLTFSQPNIKKFPCLKLAYDALKIGKSAPCFLNGANEVLVSRFLSKEITWAEIAIFLEQLLNEHVPNAIDTLEDILEVDRQARLRAATIIQKMSVFT
ncbi:MAG: 1-deoxy-D-xylulose-5-phosphate reductoisomerase [Chlamydiales bacterium]